MMVDILPLAMLVLGLTIVDTTLACFAFTRNRRRYRYAFVALMAMEIVMAWGYLLDIDAVSLSDKLLWNNVEYIGYIGAVPISFIFVLRFIGSQWMNRRRTIAFLALPSVLWISLFLNPYHHLFYASMSISSNPFISFTADHGPVFYVYVGYTLVLVFAAVGLLIRHYCLTSGQHRKHVGIVTMATMLPLAATFINFVQVTEIPGPFLVIAGLFVSGFLLYIGAFGFEMFDMVPFAFDRVVGTIEDSVFVLDEGDLVLFMNSSAVSLTGIGTEEAYHRPILDIVPGGGLLADALSLGGSSPLFLELVPGKFFDASVTSIVDPGKRSVGKLVILNDVTEKKRGNDLAKEAEDKTHILNSITRHDINNQLLVVDGNVDLLRVRLTEEGLKKHLESISMASKNISNQLAFLRDYQEIGVKDPLWQNIGAMMSRVPLPWSDKGIKMNIETRNAEILADTQLEKVFYNLVDNSMTHGNKVSCITISIRESPEIAELCYEDDGSGIAEGCREHLFMMTPDGDHGAGLFLSKKILAITGMTIGEEGEPGKGVRFVIRVDRSKIRFP